MTLQAINAAASPEVQVNENFETLEFAAVYGKRHPVTTGLMWGYYGGRWNGFSVTDGTLTLTNAATNYVVANRSSGAVSVSTSSTNWDTPGTYARVYKITTAGSLVTAVEDHRAGLYGVHGPNSSGTAGKHMIPILAAAMKPRSSGGCASLATVAVASGPDINTLDFDQTSQEYAQFVVPMPKSWNEGTITFQPIWSHASGGSTFGVVFSLKAVAFSNDDAMGTGFGTAQTSTDTGGTANDLYVGPESSAITIAGTPAAQDVVYFELSRETGNGSDTLNLDARLHGIMLYITTDAENDA